MRIRFARPPPLFRGEKSTKLSPPSADKELAFSEFSRMTPSARMRPSSARRASADMRSGQRGLGPETGPDVMLGMATFRDWNDAMNVSRNQESTSNSIFYGQHRPARRAAYFCVRRLAHQWPPHAIRGANQPASPPMNLSNVSMVGSSSSSAISQRDGARSG